MRDVCHPKNGQLVVLVHYNPRYVYISIVLTYVGNTGCHLVKRFVKHLQFLPPLHFKQCI